MLKRFNFEKYRTPIMNLRLLIFFTCAFFISRYGHAQLCPGYTLGPDTIIPCGSSVTLQAPAGWGNYVWSTGSTSSSITTSNTGNYWCRSVDTLSNVVVNGDFSQGQTGFQSDYIPGTGGSWGLLSNPGTYAVTTNSNLVHSNFPFCYDHTTSNGANSMLVVNGASVPNQRAWYQTVAVQPNTTYIFSVWFTSVDPGSPAILQFSVNSTTLGSPFSLSTATCYWQNFFGTWNSGPSTTATISILNQNTTGGGNDFAIDDILFAPICVMRDTVAVTRPPAPVITVTGGDTICAGDSITLTVSSDTPGSSFQWQPGGFTTPSITVGPASDTYYSARAGYMNCWSAYDSTEVTLAAPLNTSVTGPAAICPGGTAQLTATLTGGWGTVSTQWDPGAVYGTTINVSPAATQTYTFVATDNCESDTLTHLLTVHPDIDPQVSVSDNLQCIPLYTTFDLTTYTNAQNITWHFGDGLTGNADPQQHCYTAAGLYDVSVAVQDVNGCRDSLFLPGMVEAYPLPVADFTSDPFMVTSLDPVVDFTNESIGGTLFSWSFGDGEFSSDENPTHTYVPAWIIEDEISVQLIVTNAYGCSDTVSKPMAVQNLVTFYIPNAFTPNNDGTNDLFFPKGDGISRMRTQIFNRWGHLVYENYNLFAAWDGTDQDSGEPCQQGVYTYVVDLLDQYGKEYRYTERISLIR